MTEKCKQVAMALCNADGGDAEQIFQATDHIMGCPAVAGTCPMCEVENYTVLAKAAIEAHEAVLKAEGLVIVPREPTDGMIDAGVGAREKLFVGLPPEKQRTILVSDHPAGTIYVAMITAALEAQDAD